MSKSEFAQAYTERMFPDIAAPAGYIDPEFEVLFDNFAFDEVITEELLKDVFDLDVIIHRDPISNTPMFILK